MKKLLVFILVMFSFCSYVYALEHVDMTIDKEELNKGDSITITLVVKDVNSWNISLGVESFSDCKLEDKGTSSDGANTTKTFTKTCTATSAGDIEVAASGTYTTTEDSTPSFLYSGKTITVKDTAGGSNGEEVPNDDATKNSVASDDETTGETNNPTTGGTEIIGGILIVLLGFTLYFANKNNISRQI